MDHVIFTITHVKLFFYYSNSNMMPWQRTGFMLVSVEIEFCHHLGQVVQLDFGRLDTRVAYGCWEVSRGPDDRGINRPATIAISLVGARRKKKTKC
jgi:hypothetical protein